MKAVLQRVSRAGVTIEGEECRTIGAGFVVLLGVTHGDTHEIAAALAKKTAGLRVFSDENDAMNLSLLDIGGEMLVVSNFTLYANSKKGRRPSFIEAARPELAKPLYEHFVQCLRQEGVAEIQTGEFGASMEIELVNDGPVTIVLDSDQLFDNLIRSENI